MSQEKLLIFGIDVRHPEVGLKIVVSDIKNYLKSTCVYELGNGIPQFLNIQRIFRTNFFWGQISDDSLVCMKFHEKSPTADSAASKEVAQENYFTVVSKVTGILKDRKINNFVFRGNLMFVTCKDEDRLFLIGFGVGIMN